MQPLLEVKGLKKTYSNFKLDGVSFSIYEDCITGFIGANGAGKTTTIRSILNLISCEAGSIKFKGKDTKKAEKSLEQAYGEDTQGAEATRTPRKTLFFFGANCGRRELSGGL